MTYRFAPEIQDVIETVHYRPAISIIMPFEPNMFFATELKHRLKFAKDKVQKELVQNYSEETSRMMIQKLNTLINKLNFNSHSKSIAIYLSPVFEKVLYLDFPVEEKIIIDESFEIRDVVYAKKEYQEFLVLLISSEESKVYLGSPNGLKKIKSNKADYRNDIAEPVANFSDPSYRREVLLKKFLHHTDKEFGQLLNAYPLPVFVMGTIKTLGYFKEITKNQKGIVGFIPGNYNSASENELRGVLEFYIADWRKVKEDNLLHRLEKAADERKLSTGIKEVWKQASHHRGQLLVVEKNYRCRATHGSNEDNMYEGEEPYQKFYIKDAVDDIIEKVLEQGGDVEFVEPGTLKPYQRIALINYY